MTALMGAVRDQGEGDPNWKFWLRTPGVDGLEFETGDLLCWSSRAPSRCCCSTKLARMPPPEVSRPISAAKSNSHESRKALLYRSTSVRQVAVSAFEELERTLEVGRVWKGT